MGGGYRVVFHISSHDLEAFDRMVSNIYNLIKDVGESSVDVIVVANGSGVRHFLRTSLDEKRSKRLSRLRERGVRFYICGNSLKAQGLKEEDIDEKCEIIPAGITLLVR